MVSYSSLDTSVYFNSNSTTDLHSTNNNHTSSIHRTPSNQTESQNINQLFNNHVTNLNVVDDLFHQSNSRNHSIDLSCHSSNPKSSIISDSADQSCKNLTLSNQHTCSKSPHHDQNDTIPNHTLYSNSLHHKSINLNMTLALENLNQLQNPVHTQSPNQFNHPNLSLISSAISPLVQPLQVDHTLNSASGSSFSRSPQTDSSTSSRHTENSDQLPSSSSDSFHPSNTQLDLSLAFNPSHPPLVEIGRPPLKNSQLSFCSNSNLSDNFNLSSSVTPTCQIQNFRDYNSIQNSPDKLGIISKLNSSTHSSPTEFCRKVNLNCNSTELSSTQLNNTESLPPSSIPPLWLQYPSLDYPVNFDPCNQHQSCHALYPTQTGMKPLLPMDHKNQPIKNSKIDPNQSSEPSLNPSHTSLSPTGWSTDELNDNNSSSTLVSGNIPLNDNQCLFNFPTTHSSTPAYGQSEPTEDQFKFVHHHRLSNFDSNQSNSLGLLSSTYHSQGTPLMEKTPKKLMEPADKIETTRLTQSNPPEETGHNAVEKRYRNNINSHIAALADLVPALQHLRSLPSAATSRRHSSQFIVSTSAIGKIPSGLVDGVKAATKLSKGNILSKSVDYMRHLLRRRAELNEDIEDLKHLVKGRVEGGEEIILQWEEMVNNKSSQRQRQRIQEQNQGEEDADEEGDEMIESNHIIRKSSPFNHLPLFHHPAAKKRKNSLVKFNDLNHSKFGKIVGF